MVGKGLKCLGCQETFFYSFSIPVSSINQNLHRLKWNVCVIAVGLPTYPNFSNPTLNIKMVFGEKIPKMGTFSDFVAIFFVKCYNKI